MATMLQQLRMLHHCSTLCVLLGVGLVAPLAAQTVDSFNPGADYNVDTLMVQPDGRVLVGGSFGTLAGHPCSSLGRLNEDGTLDLTFNAAASGDVICLAVQTDGQILAGGSFSSLGGQTRNNLGRLQANGTLDRSFNPGANNTVHCLALQADGKMLVAGKFTTLAGATRDHLGRLNADGSLDNSFNPGVDGDVYALALQPDGKILVGGLFTTLGGQTRINLGRLSANGSVDGTFTAAADGSVLSLVVQANGKVLVGGSFATLAGQTRNYLGRLHGEGTLDTNFVNLAIGPPAINNGVYSLVIQADGKIVAGGLFSTVGGYNRESIVRLNGDGTVDANFSAAASFTVYALALQADGRILAAGQFTSFGGQPRAYLGRLNNTISATQSLTIDGDNVIWLRGGTSPEAWRTTFEVSTNGADWLSLGSGQRVPDGWRLTGVTIPVTASIRARGFVAGGRENGSSGFVESLTGSLAISMQPLSRTNNAGTAASFRVLAGGDGLLSYQWRKNGLSLGDEGKVSGVQTSTLTISNVFGADAAGYSVIVSNTSGSVTSRVAILNVLDPFIVSQPASRTVNAGQNATFSVSVGGTIPLHYQWRKGGEDLPGATASSLTLTNVLWTDRGNYDVRVSNVLNSVTSAAATLSVNMTAPDALNPGANGDVQALACQPDGKILVGGKFTLLGSYRLNHLGRLHSNGAVDTNFNLGTTGGAYPTVAALTVQSDGKILVGGDFTTLGGQPRTNIGRLNADGSLDLSFNPGATGPAFASVAALIVQADGKILVGGRFSTLAGGARTCLGRLNGDGSLDPSFNPSVVGISDPSINTLAVEPGGKILVAGNFKALSGSDRNGIGRLHPDGSVDTNFNPGVSLSAHCFAVQADGKILVGGNFTTLAATPRSHIGRLNADGSVDPSFNPGASWTVFSLAVQTDGKILAAGAFTTLASQICNYVGRLHLDGSLDPTFNAPANSYVNALALQADGKILVGGSFMFLGGQPRNRLGRLSNSEAATQELRFDGSSISWLRGATSPEVRHTRFEVSTNGTDWLNLGDGVRMTGGWELTGLAPFITNVTVRARGQVSGGHHNGSSWFVEDSLVIVPQMPPRIVVEDGGFGVQSNQFGFHVAGVPGQVVVVQASTNLLDWVPLQTNTLGGGAFYFSDPDTERHPFRFYRAARQ